MIVKGTYLVTSMEASRFFLVVLLSNFFRLLHTGLDRVRREKYGLVLDATTAKFFASQEPCDLNTSESWATGKHYAFATRKGSPLLGEINNVITR